MKKFFLLALVVSIPLFYFIQVWQVSRCNNLKQEVAVLEQEQDDWIDQNKKVLADISLYRSPDRIEILAENELGLEPVDSSRITIINIQQGGTE